MRRRTSLGLPLLLIVGVVLPAAPARADGSFPDPLQILLPVQRPRQIILVTNFGLFLSDDNGKSWLFSCEQALNAYAGPYLLGAAPTQRLFAIASGGLIYSDDDSCGWQPARGVLTEVLPYAFAVDPSDARRVYAIGVPREDLKAAESIYASDDGGLTFGRAVFTAPAQTALLTVVVAPSRPSTLFASMFSATDNHPALLRSDDSGEHWHIAADLLDSLGPNPFELLAVDPLDERKLYARVLDASAETLAVSADGGLSFIKSASIPGKLKAFVKLASGTILVGGTAGTEAVAFRSINDTQSFEPWLGAPHIHALAERDGMLYVAADNFLDGYAIAASADEGVHLQPLMGFKQVSGVRTCVADVCTESCKYYADIDLWPNTVCEPPSFASGLAGAIGTLANAGAAPTGGGGGAGAAEISEAGRSCACSLAQTRRSASAASLLTLQLVAAQVLRRRARRKSAK